MPEKNKIHKPIVLIILDGWGINQDYPGNAITNAKTPAMDRLVKEYPSTTLRASGESVGLPWGEAGNSEVGHLNMGLGRVLYQDLPRINKAIADQTFYQNEALLKAVEHVKKNNSNLHFLGVVSNGCVHASVDHLHALMVLAQKNNIRNFFIHAILDGRDTQFNSGLNFIRGVERSIKEFSMGQIATVSGRFYTMDRNNNWDRTEKAYLALTEGIGEKGTSASDAVRESYKKKIYDEEFLPTVIFNGSSPSALIKDNDAVIFYNFRPDRARQITEAFISKEFNRFKRKKFLQNLEFVTFTEYDKNFPVEIAFPLEDMSGSLGEELSKAGVKQLRISETEKYAHVTYFFNGGIETKMPGEDHDLVPSPNVSSYAEKPEMSSEELTKRILKAVESDKYDFILVNFPNADMVGHTGNLEAAIKGVEALDKCVDKIVSAVLEKDGIVLITADHGNAEIMFNMQTGQIDKEHTTNPVPIIIAGNDFHGKSFGWQEGVGSDLSLATPQGILADIAPTILQLFDIAKSDKMTGESLLWEKI